MSLTLGIWRLSCYNGSYAINSDFEEFFYSEETKKNIALVASLCGLLQQYKGTPLFDSVTKLIYFLLPVTISKSSKSDLPDTPKSGLKITNGRMTRR